VQQVESARESGEETEDATSKLAVSGATTPAKLRGRPFVRGSSGNPKGRPKGSRNKATLAIEMMLEGEADAITRKVIDLALAGDMTAIRLCLERLVPPRRDRLVAFELPEIETASDAQKASSAALAACADGALTPDEAMNVMSLISAHTRIIETVDLDARLRALEERQDGNA
jgi:hypothetical protein